MTRRIHDHFTQARFAWLSQLEREPGSTRPNRVGYDCMVLGWTQWAGQETGKAQRGEKLTTAGRTKLADWKSS